ncbi:MAG: hypothetical protein H0T73_05940 [Ardenticatenales bacterium]|nr:hypothetical protein [Ardenticatenales bacterium]
MRNVEEDNVDSGRPSIWLWLIAMLLIVAMGSVLGWVIAGGLGREELAGAPSVEEGVPPLLPSRTPKPTFTAIPTSTFSALAPTAEAPLLPSPPPGVAVTLEAPPNAVLFQVQIEEIPVYRGPGITYPRLGLAPRGTTLLVAGRTPDGGWWLVCCVDSQSGWMELKDQNVLVQGDVALVDVIALPGTSGSTFQTPTPPPAPPSP